MKFPIAGQAYQLPSVDINNQRCVNLYPTLKQGPESDMALVRTPGLKSLIDTGGTNVRALIEFGNILYAIVDDKFYEITVDRVAQTATKTERGTLATTSGRISWDVNPTQIMIVAGDTGYVYAPASTTFTEITDPDFTGGTNVVFMDSYFIYNTPNASTIYATAINDGTSVDALDVTTAEKKPDKTVGLAVDKGELWVFGEKSIEIYFNAANPTGFPFSLRNGAAVDQGCAAAHSIVSVNNTLMWLDDRGYIVNIEGGYGIRTVSTEAINAEINKYPKIDDAFAYTYIESGHQFYVITFPSANKTWVYDLTLGAWHERASYDLDKGFMRHIGNCAIQHKRLNLLGGYNDGTIYIMDRDFLDDDGEEIRRLRTTQHFTVENKLVGIPEFELHIEAGRGLQTGQGSDPQIMMRYSNDGGIRWSHELWRSLGKVGEYGKRCRWNRLGSAREWIFEFSYSEPTEFVIMEAYMELEGGKINTGGDFDA